MAVRWSRRGRVFPTGSGPTKILYHLSVYNQCKSLREFGERREVRKEGRRRDEEKRGETGWGTALFREATALLRYRRIIDYIEPLPT